ncbi:MAG TPA: zinc ABC transporter substrate-binding protein [Steroidobacteraceae bacterium]|jgi:zinc/manganese transport system substrate-binding protein|nr:zinc ABC transporter substrate-binding protein [Steroidobacteraceae bacterium]
MKKLIRVLALSLAAAASLPANAALKVLATTPDWGALAQELGGDRVNVYVATTALQDVHRVEARPSLVARARSADLVVATGAELEVGWLPVLIQESGNAKIQRGARGYFEAASALSLLEVPSQVDRAMGDIHPYGNPHVHLDPHNIRAVAHALTARLSQLDPGQAAYYASRAQEFDARWDGAIRAWEGKAAPLKGVKVVILHRDQVYLCQWLGLVEVASIEPKPGVPPTAAYLGTLVGRLTTTPPKLILLNAYNDPKAANWLAERMHVPAVVLPFSVGGSDRAKDLFGLFDDTLDKLLAALK